MQEQIYQQHQWWVDLGRFFMELINDSDGYIQSSSEQLTRIVPLKKITSLLIAYYVFTIDLRKKSINSYVRIEGTQVSNGKALNLMRFVDRWNVVFRLGGFIYDEADEVIKFKLNATLTPDAINEFIEAFNERGKEKEELFVVQCHNALLIQAKEEIERNQNQIQIMMQNQLRPTMLMRNRDALNLNESLNRSKLVLKNCTLQSSEFLGKFKCIEDATQEYEYWKNLLKTTQYDKESIIYRDIILLLTVDQVRMQLTENNRVSKNIYLVKIKFKQADGSGSEQFTYMICKVKEKTEIIGLFKGKKSDFIPVYFNTTPRLEGLVLMEYCNRGNLRTLMNNKVQRSLRRNLDYIYQIAVGLKVLNETKIQHNDLKPENIFVISQQKQLKIGDFGEATHEKFPKVPGYSPNYVAPEQLELEETQMELEATTKLELKTQTFNPQHDIFSLGVIMYELLIQEYPFPTRIRINKNLEPKKYREKLQSQLQNLKINTDAFYKLGPKKIIKPLIELITKCLSPQPEKRPLVDWILAFLRLTREQLEKIV